MTFPGFRLGFHGVDENRNHDGPAIDAIKLSCFPHNTILDLGDFMGSKFEAGGTHNALCLLSVADTDDRGRDGRFFNVHAIATSPGLAL
jgi:hypothetical protein